MIFGIVRPTQLLLSTSYALSLMPWSSLLCTVLLFLSFLFVCGSHSKCTAAVSIYLGMVVMYWLDWFLGSRNRFCIWYGVCEYIDTAAVLAPPPHPHIQSLLHVRQSQKLYSIECQPALKSST